MSTPADLDLISDFQHKLSSIPKAGNGLYVARSFAKGDAVCYFSGEVREFPHSSPLCREHELPFEGKFIVGDQVPSVEHPGGVAQLVNDGALPWLAFRDVVDDDVGRVHHIACQMVLYLEASTKSQNIQRRDAVSTVFIAMRDIQPGEELYHTYGSHWWLEWYTSRIWDDKVKRALGFSAQALRGAVSKDVTELDAWRGIAVSRLKFAPSHIRSVADVNKELEKARDTVRLLKRTVDRKRSMQQNQQLRKQKLWIQDLLEFIPQLQSCRR